MKAYFMLNIFDGFLFHMLWEAQARYILGYFVLLLPLAACGLYFPCDKTFTSKYSSPIKNDKPCRNKQE